MPGPIYRSTYGLLRMIKVEYENLDDIVRLSFTSNKGEDENDILDAIGNAILTSAPKRGSYDGSTMRIDIRKRAVEVDV